MAMASTEINRKPKKNPTNERRKNKNENFNSAHSTTHTHTHTLNLNFGLWKCLLFEFLYFIFGIFFSNTRTHMSNKGKVFKRLAVFQIFIGGKEKRKSNEIIISIHTTTTILQHQ